MKVVDLHPEDLIDKLAAGELTPAERERLNAHISQCRVCRFEIDARGEFEQEMPVFALRPQLTLPGASERTQPPGPAPRVSAVGRPRARGRWLLSMLAAALLLCAGGAAAAVFSGAVQPNWLPWVPEAHGGTRATSAKGASKMKRATPQRAIASEPASVAGMDVAGADVAGADVASAEERAPSLPPARVDPLAEPAPVRASAPSMAKRATKVAPATAAIAHAAEKVSVASAPRTTSEAGNSRHETAPGVEAAAPRLDPAAVLFADANRARRDGNAERAVTLYRALQSRYPNSAESALSRALLAQLLLERGSPEAALSGFDRYLAADAPVLSAEALVGRARALEQLGKSAQAVTAWRDVQSRFPGSVHARLAATRLAALGMR